MSKYDSVCFGCNERTATCHGTCEKFKADTEKRSAITQVVNAERDRIAMVNGYEVARARAHKRRMHDDR